MPDDTLPPWFEILRKDLAAQALSFQNQIAELRRDLGTQIQSKVSQELFTSTLQRYDDKIADLGGDIVEERVARVAAITAEQTMRDAQVGAEREARMKAHAETDARSKRAWSLVKWSVGTLIAAAAVVVAVWAVVVK